MKYLHAFVAGLGGVFDAVAGVPPGDLEKEVGMVVIVLSSFGVLHVANAPALVSAVVAAILAVAGAGVAVERVVKALKG